MYIRHIFRFIKQFSFLFTYLKNKNTQQTVVNKTSKSTDVEMMAASYAVADDVDSSHGLPVSMPTVVVRSEK